MSTFPSESLKYICAWRQVLGGWLGWDDARAQKFIDRWWPQITGVDVASDFYHEWPIQCVSTVLVPRNLWESYDGLQRVQLVQQIEQAVYNGPCDAHCWPDYDWAAARKRVEGVLASHGVSLPKPNELTWYEHEELHTKN